MIVSASGRPLRFFGIVMVGWITIRLFSQPGPAMHFKPARGLAAVAAARLPMPSPAMPYAAPAKKTEQARARWTTPVAMSRSIALTGPATNITRPAVNNNLISLDLMNFSAFANPHYASALDYMQAPPPSPLPLSAPARPDRWHGSGWILWRGNTTTTDDAGSIGRLGGSQAGLRIDYDLAPSARTRTVAYARATSALQQPSAPEAAIGIAIQPVRTIPISLAAERRLSLGKGARAANALMAVGGFGPAPIGRDINAEAYAQAGVVGFNRRDAFIDGKFSLLSPVTGMPVRIGTALSGGAQPGVERLDIGPELQARLPLPGVTTRIAVEWRARIAGRAAPTSGLAITLATDF